MLTNEYPNLLVIPMIHNVDIHKTENVPLVVINLLTDSVYLSKGEIMGFMQSQSLDISEVTTETSTEPSPILLEEDNDIEGLKEQKKETTSEYTKKKFITSPADIDVHRKVDLLDAEVTEDQQKAFKELCNEYKDIFSTDSSDIGKMPLTRDLNCIPVIGRDQSPKDPISSFKTYYLDTERVGSILEKWVIVRSVTPWAFL